jgi:excisionase family DNA binding protein
MSLEQFYTIEDVADKLKVTRQAIHNWIKEGRIESIKIGRSRRIPASSLHQLLENSRELHPKAVAGTLPAASPA